MSEDSLRRRLESLNRGQPPDDCETSAGGMLSRSVSMLTSLRSESKPPTAKKRPASRTVPPLPGLVRRGEVIETSAGEHLRIRLPLEELWRGGQQLAVARGEHLRRLLCVANEESPLHPDFAAFVRGLPDRVLFLDLETCGLAGSALFLAGLLRCIDGAPAVELLLARNYAEEQAVLESLWRTVAGHDVLVTFNGKSFDWPMVADRSVRHRLAARPTAGQASSGTLTHVDVLHHARRKWRGQLPDCRLQTLEARICRRRRVGDIESRLIPAAYAEYVRTGFEREMDAILYHNAVDLVTLFDLALRLATD